MPPTDEEIRVAIAALRSDAAEWRAWAGALGRASIVVDQLDLSANDMSALSTVVGLPEMYSALRTHAHTLAALGEARFTEVAGALVAAADGYERDERNAVHRLRGVW